MKRMKKYPLIDILLKRFPEKSRKELIALVYCREIFVNGEVILDPRRPVSDDSSVEIRVKHYVSRGGYKLEYALDSWDVEPRDRIVLDAGASTGGFTHCLLQRGARKVYAVDVGYNQLDFSLRRDARVVVLEKTNVMHLSQADLSPVPDMAVADLSFRSIHGAARHILGLTSGNMLIALIKPQFEWVSPPSYFNGVIKRKENLYNILIGLVDRLSDDGVVIRDVIESPMQGQKGNREFFFLMELSDIGGDFSPLDLVKEYDKGFTTENIKEKIESLVFR